MKLRSMPIVKGSTQSENNQSEQDSKHDTMICRYSLHALSNTSYPEILHSMMMFADAAHFSTQHPRKKDER
jgi:hypothetical protein